MNMKNLKQYIKSFASGTRRFLREKGIYVTVTCCVAAVALTAALMFSAKGGDGPNAETGRSGDQTLSEAQAATPRPASPSPSAVPSPSPSATLVPDFTAAPAPSPSPSAAPARTKLSSPVSGGVIWEYAADRLVYSKTLRQWMTHPGVDIAGSVGEAVRAVAGGTVTAAYTDDALGFTVVIEHDNGHETVYANLQRTGAVAAGQLVEQGQAIGTVGETSVSECALEPHIHFEYHVDGKIVDPMKYVYIPEG